MVRPSCPALVIHDDDAFRKALIAALDQHHFTVTFTIDGERAAGFLRDGKFNVVLIGVNLATRAGLHSLELLREQRELDRLAVIVVGEPDPQLRTYAPWADETLLKPVDAAYVAQRANAYCAQRE
jgi:DNA-binding response OmpR family regulator